MESFIAEPPDAQFICYATMASVAVIMYDQTLNFSQEVDFVWNRRWTVVTALYFVARYCGPASQFAMLAVALPLNWTPAEYKHIMIVAEVLNLMFIIAMQATLLLRAYVVCNRSRKVLAFLSVSLVCEVIMIVVVVVKSLGLVAMGGLTTFMDLSGSIQSTSSANSDALGRWLMVYRAIQLAFDILLLVVALFGSVKHALEVGGWSVSPLVKALAEDQIAYFVWYAVWQGTTLLSIIGVNVGISALDGLNSLFGAFAIIAGPHMVISVRVQELKTREGTLQPRLSVMQFNVREPMHTHGSSSRREVNSDA